MAAVLRNAKTRLIPDTLLRYSCKGPDSGSCKQECHERIKSSLSKYNTMFSMYVEGSDIYNINHAQGMPVAVSSDTATLIKKKVSTTAIYPMDL